MIEYLIRIFQRLIAIIRKGNSPGIQTLKLSTRHDLTLPVNIRVAAPVKSSHLIVQKSSVLNFLIVGVDREEGETQPA